ncbi:MAG TPA: hypothetical protein VGB22_03995 [candidate division Zixibacteria bacterium]|jgi:hypothetical protein
MKNTELVEKTAELTPHNRIQSNRPWWKDAKFWITTVVSLLAVAVAFDARDKALTVNVRLNNLVGEEGRTLLVTELEQTRRLLIKTEGAISDSIEAGRNRAGAKGFAGGSVHTYEIKRALEPLRELVEEEWFGLDRRIAKLLAQMGHSADSLNQVESLVDLNQSYAELRIQKDSVLCVIQVAIEQSGQ